MPIVADSRRHARRRLRRRLRNRRRRRKRLQSRVLARIHRSDGNRSQQNASAARRRRRRRTAPISLHDGVAFVRDANRLKRRRFRFRRRRRRRRRKSVVGVRLFPRVVENEIVAVFRAAQIVATAGETFRRRRSRFRGDVRSFLA